MHRQLSFDLPVRAALGREDFFVAPANAMAVALIEGWRDWPGRKLVLEGPKGAGKTHLAHVWAQAAGARIVEARALAGADIPDLASGPVAVEDVPLIAGDTAAENALFHLHNLTLAEGHSLLLTADRPAAHWGLTLPDLASRMQGTQATRLEAPDDRLLTALLAKLFADRQLIPTPDTIPYLVTRMDRSFDSARQLVAALDAAALAQGRPINRKLAADVMERFIQPGLLDNSPD
ncbi:DnaA/Hda family protein [Seohaeicola sp. SP36]|uniref:DnaA ATPase domain-containing protein n=1 Tax=unclassified Seohaeicola TaxID=2641111 RepID=UPI00237BF48D|nr:MULTISPECIES: DnaA/Hda family protein [unclassified Seohaeicola]MDD9708120.1 DnaA/Hda family protein [Seohaeicola sp. 4SK31]MDD9736084.1 DnaA/Hda family protein [Seohaeicola sp. SP36]